VLFVTKKLKKVMLTDSVKAPLRLEELPVPLTVIKELHKHNLQNARILLTLPLEELCFNQDQTELSTS